jgi:hypothetical protein
MRNEGHPVGLMMLVGFDQWEHISATRPLQQLIGAGL